MSDSTYEIAKSLGLTDENDQSSIDDNTFYIIFAVICCFCIIGSLFFIVIGIKSTSGDIQGGDNADIISAIAEANQTKLPVTINLTTSPQYYPKLN